MSFFQFVLVNHLISWPFVIGSYFFLGAGIKFIDDAFDEHTFNKFQAMLLAPILGIYWAAMMSLSPDSATVLAAIVLCVFLTGKIDNLAFQVGTLSIIVLLFLFGFLNFLWIPLAVITFTGIVDEWGNDYVDEHHIKNRFVNHFFKDRFTMKLGVLAFAALAFIGWLYFFAFLAWDIAYAIVTRVSANIKHKRKFYYYQMPEKLWGLI